MCCDICSKYEECEADGLLKDECCNQCGEYDYCKDSEDNSDENPDDDNDELNN